MSDKFYDFDKDAAFDEVYSDKIVKKPVKKEYEIEISLPKTELKSTMPQSKTPQTKPQKAVKPKKKKMSKGKIALATVGIILSCLIVYLGSFLLTILNWHKLPSFEETKESTIDDVKQAEEYVVISDDGETVEVVPMYKDTQSGDDSSSSENEEDKDTEEGGNEDEDSSLDNTPSSGSDDTESNEVIDV